LLALDAGELEQDLGADFGGNLTIEHDLSKVVALQENEDARHTRAVAGWNAGLLQQNEARRMIGLADVPMGDIFKAPAMLPGGGQPQIIDVTPGKARSLLEIKAAPGASVERRMEKAVSRYLAQEYEAAAAAVQA
jgi:hypothetical protein